MSNSTLPRSSRSGLTLLELLVALAVLGIALALVGLGLGSWRTRLSGEQFVQGLAYDLNLSRSRTMATAVTQRVVLVDASTYRVERQTATGWQTTSTVRARGAALTSLAGGACRFEYDTRGFMFAYTCGGNLTSNTNVTATVAGKARTVTVTALGIARGL
ncbi:prepilin-type N-terminal cleavage/methylation domain-containing protein [Deinococcus pimensis]|uniref:prepilin-type N-terminal cleavage/methylation domain-containing protein n=1 Tax=Deinococcus pimensis TaxID=309888 RepID=UPI0004867B9B|nr:prepilin-type N-terminal cleavage/methylation domain-containing protein [Deinococcus pimensis]